MSVSVNEGISAVCFGWGTARGRAAEGAETVRESAASQRSAAGGNRDKSTVSLCVKTIFIHTGNSELKGFRTRLFIRVAIMEKEMGT